MMNLTVNGKDYLVSGSTLTYEEIVELAGLPLRNDYTMVFRNPQTGASGSITLGDNVEAADGAIINVGHTGNA